MFIPSYKMNEDDFPSDFDSLDDQDMSSSMTPYSVGSPDLSLMICDAGTLSRTGAVYAS